MTDTPAAYEAGTERKHEVVLYGDWMQGYLARCSGCPWRGDWHTDSSVSRAEHVAHVRNHEQEAPDARR